MSVPPVTAVRRILSRSTWENVQHVGVVLRRETVGGALLIGAAVLALVLANSAFHETYAAVRDYPIGLDAIHLTLPVGMWAADALLAVFFFIAGMELKRELKIGDLSDPAKAAVPIVAAFCGVIVPALVYLAVNTLSTDPETRYGWAVPTATDIAFALAVLAVIGSHLPAALRSFLLTLAVVDDLIAITIIAVFYTHDLHISSLLIALGPLVLFAYLARTKPGWWRWLMLPLALLTWYFIHHSGIHATVAGVLLGLVIPVHRAGEGRPGDNLAHDLEHRIHPFSAGVCVPLFAFFAAGVYIGGDTTPFWLDTAAMGTILGLVLGKLVGVLGGTWAVAKFTRAELDEGLAWWDVVGLALLSGIGFTVSLLVSELAFGPGTPHDNHVKIGVLVGSVLAAASASVILRIRNGVYRAMAEDDVRDLDHDGIPDVYQTIPAPATSPAPPSSTMDVPALHGSEDSEPPPLADTPPRPTGVAPKEDS